jgi:hypothetical protein
MARVRAGVEWRLDAGTLFHRRDRRTPFAARPKRGPQMSVRAAAWAIGQQAPDHIAKLALVWLGDHADEFAVTALDPARLSVFAQCAPSAAEAALRRLAAVGLITFGHELPQGGAAVRLELPGERRSPLSAHRKGH